MRISLITPSFNQARFIRRTIDSVLGQQGDFDLEYRVIDGGSQDGTLEILRSYGERLRWTSAPDGGQVDALNKGLRQATGEVVGWLNSDDLLLPGALARVAAALAPDSPAEWVHGRCLIIDEHDWPVRRWIAAYKHMRARRHTFRGLLTENYVSQMTAFWRRRVLDEVGYLDPEVDLAFDYDLWLRLARRGPPIYLEEPIACFRWYETSKSGSQFEAQFVQDERIAARYADGQRWTMARKRLRNSAIVGVYRLAGVARSLVRRVAP